MVDAFVCLLLFVAGTDIGKLGFFDTRNFVLRYGPTGINTFTTGGYWKVSRMEPCHASARSSSPRYGITMTLVDQRCASWMVHEKST